MNRALFKKINSTAFESFFTSLLKEIKDKKVLIYGAGSAFEILKKRFNLEDLNIVAIADIKFKKNGMLYGIKSIPPSAINEFDFDVVLMTLFYPTEAIEYLQYDLKINKNIEIRNVFEELVPNENDFLTYLEEINFDKQLVQISKRTKNKRLIIYGAGMFFETIKTYYDIRSLNIVALSDAKFYGYEKDETFLNFPVCSPEDIKKLNPDYIFVATLHIEQIMESLNRTLQLNKVKILPLAQHNFESRLRKISKFDNFFQKFYLTFCLFLSIIPFFKEYFIKKVETVFVNEQTDKTRVKIYNKYKRVFKKIRSKIKNKQKIRVGFLVSENQKWSAQSLYDVLDKSDDFEPFIMVTLYQKLFDIKYSDKRNLDENCEFFKSRNMKVEVVYDIENKEYLSLNIHKPDIVFYQQPWSLDKLQNIFAVSNFALCAYVNYGSALTNGINEYQPTFFKFIWKYFIDNEIAKKVLIDKGVNSSIPVVSGQVKLDFYKKNINLRKNIWPNEGNLNVKRIIYAPHHSFYESSLLKFGTFQWNGIFMLEFAKNHPEMDFIFKPHPVLRNSLVKFGLMNSDERDEYFMQWDNLPNTKIYDKGDYFDIFKSSDGMITDCNSFLLEYLPTQKPVLHLLNKSSVGHNKFGEKITKGYYKIRNTEQLQKTITQVFINGNDYLLKKRKSALENVYIPQNGVGEFIKEYLLNNMAGEK